MNKLMIQRLPCPQFVVFVRQFPCVVCGQKSDAHHLTAVGAGGPVAEDFTCVPLCRVHHSIAHTMTTMNFNRQFNVDLWRESHRMVLAFLKTGERFTTSFDGGTLLFVKND